MNSLHGLVAIVTGAGSGMGRASALALAGHGASVVCTDIRKSANPDGFEVDKDIDTDELIRARGGKAAYLKVDVRHAAEIEAAVAVAVSRFGRLDIMVNNAGLFTSLVTADQQSEEDWDLTMAVNAKGVWLGSKYALRQMMAQPPRANGARGRIINTASVGGQSGLHLEPAYCASKGAVLALTRQMATDFGPHHIGVNAVMPGVIQTAMTRVPLSDVTTVGFLHQVTPFPCLGTAEDVANAVAFLASDEASFINGAALAVDGGFLAF
jgi:NAD(P)-dependent dehydrogenase (short-subunit alcohol dehydrogenase family)